MLTIEHIQALAKWAGKDNQKQKQAYELLLLDSWAEEKKATDIPLKKNIGLVLETKAYSEKLPTELFHHIKTFVLNENDFDKHAIKVFGTSIYSDNSNVLVNLIRKIKKGLFEEKTEYTIEKNYKPLVPFSN